jgi:hypothetical protein
MTSESVTFDGRIIYHGHNCDTHGYALHVLNGYAEKYRKREQKAA